MRGKKVKQLRRAYQAMEKEAAEFSLLLPITYRAFKRLWSRQVLPREGA